MTEPNNAGAGAPPAGATNTNVQNGAAQAGANNQQNMVPLTALHEERDKRQTLSAELEALKTQMATITAAGQNNAGQGQQTVVDNNNNANEFHSNLDNMWRDDPRKAMQTELMMAINWRDKVDNGVELQVEDAAGKFKDFSTHQTEVRKFLRNLTVEQRSKPGLVDAAYYMVKGRNADVFAKTEAERLLQKSQQADGTQTIQTGASSGGGDNTNNAGTLTVDQKNAAAAMGVSEDEYAKYMKK